MTKKEKEVALIALSQVYNAMQYDESLDAYVDGGRITLSFSAEQMHMLSKSVRYLYGQVVPEQSNLHH